MAKKINVAKLLKDCPKNMELYSPIYGVGNLTKITDKIYVKFPKEHNLKRFRFDGKVSEDGKIMLFPKGKTTWEGFVPPCKFKEGDVVVSNYGDIHLLRTEDSSYVAYRRSRGYKLDKTPTTAITVSRLATDEEIQKLFDAIKDTGYKWNAETKTLEKLIEPKFKVGDRIKSMYNDYLYDVKKITDTHYTLVEIKNKLQYTERIIEDKNWKLVPNKFDITTLKPFESRVLVRDNNTQTWKPAYWGFYDKTNNVNYPYIIVWGGLYGMSIPYENNEHLLGTTDDCDEFYKTWK